MKDQLKAILSDVSFEDLQEALNTKKDEKIESLRVKKQELIAELSRITSDFANQRAEIDKQLDELIGRTEGVSRKTSSTRSGRSLRSGELTTAISKVLGVAPGRHFTASQIVESLAEVGFSGNLEDAQKKMAIYLSRMAKADKIKRVDRGVYTAHPIK